MEAGCERLLQEGLYRKFNITQSDNFSSDFRQYILSEDFTRDLKNGQWGGSLTIPIDGVPISLGANASDGEIREFKSRISNATSLSFDQNSYQNIIISIPDDEIARIYAGCIINQYGFRVDSDYGKGWAQFIVTYNPKVSSDPMPILRKINIINGNNIQTTLSVGSNIYNRNIITCDRDEDRDLVLSFETDRGVATYKIPADPIVPPTPIFTGKTLRSNEIVISNTPGRSGVHVPGIFPNISQQLMQFSFGVSLPQNAKNPTAWYNVIRGHEFQQYFLFTEAMVAGNSVYFQVSLAPTSPEVSMHIKVWLSYEMAY